MDADSDFPLHFAGFCHPEAVLRPQTSLRSVIAPRDKSPIDVARGRLSLALPLGQRAARLAGGPTEANIRATH